MKNELTEFNNGGSHEQNSLGGIPQGVNPNGKVNTVEEGETKVDINGTAYVFSNRLSMKNEYLNKYYLPNYIKGKSFSEASKAIEDRFKDKADNASMSTKESMYKRLAESQEFAKLEKEADDNGISVDKLMAMKQEQAAEVEAARAEQAQQAQQQEGQQQEQQEQQEANPIEPSNEFKTGGFLGIFRNKDERQAARQAENDGGDEGDGGGAGFSGVASAVGGAGSLLAQGLDNVNATEKVAAGGAAAKGALTGAAAGAALGPIGAAGGAIIGGALGLFTGKAGNKKVHNKKMDAQVSANTDLGLTQEGRALGGMMPTEDYHDGGYFHNKFATHPHEGDPGFKDGFGGGGRFGGGGASGGYRLFSTNVDAQRVGPSIIETTPGEIIDKDPEGIEPDREAVTPIETETIGGGAIATEQDDISNSNPVGVIPSGQRDGDSDFPFLAAGAGLSSLAPFIGNMVEGANLSAPDKNKLARVGRTYIPEFADERQLTNVVDDSFSGLGTALAGATAGNLGAYRANLLGASINKSKARAEAFRDINEVNRGERKNLNEDFAIATRENVDKYNIEQDLDKQDRAAYDAAKGVYRTAAYEGLGELGKTIFTLNQAEGLTSYDFLTGKKKKTK